MQATYGPHDLIWVKGSNALEDCAADWVRHEWHSGLPVVVRRDREAGGRIPVGVRGTERRQRSAGWVCPENIIAAVTPEALAVPEKLLASPYHSHPVIQAALALSRHDWPWQWGITGSAAYALVTGAAVLHPGSDLDLLIRCPVQPDAAVLRRWQQLSGRSGCKSDTQLESGHGGFSLEEWLRGEGVLIKTAQGPVISHHPWQKETQHENTLHLSRPGCTASWHAQHAAR